MSNYHPEYKPACKLANARIAELEETITLAYRLSLQDAWQELRELLAERSAP